MAQQNRIRFFDRMDNMFTLLQGQVPGCGEDSIYAGLSYNSAIVSVFDGCGGLGSRTYPVFRGHTGAYMASRAASGALYNWFRHEGEKSWSSGTELASSMDRYFRDFQQKLNAYGKSSVKIMGSMVRDFPTTAAIALAQDTDEGIRLHVLWCGDSRVYLLDEQGLAQLTVDDVDVTDPFENISEDGALRNVMSSDGRYQLHYKTLLLTKPAMVFAATDGCFGYVASPMEFEHMLLSALETGASFNGFKKSLEERIHEVTGDDFGFCLMSFQFGTFRSLQTAMKARKEQLEKEYMTALTQDHSREAARALWQRYRPNYTRFWDKEEPV